MLIDSHCHPEAREELERAGAAGVGGLVVIADLEFARRHQDVAGLKVWATIGVHPHEAANQSLPTAAEAGDRLVIAVGEIGLDYHYQHSPREVQQTVFEGQLGLAAAWDLPVSIHCREAFEDCLAMIAAQNPPRRGVFHCFTGTQQEAERVLELGWYLSFSGVLTFNKTEALRAIAAWAPGDRILVETDAPYLAPAPHRGQRNEPAFVTATAARLGAIRQSSAEEITQLTSANFFRLFPRANG